MAITAPRLKKTKYASERAHISLKIACNFSPAVIIYREKIQGELMKKTLKKIPKTAELMWVLGIFLVALGVTMSKKADLGVSMIAAPTFIVYEAIRPLWAMSVGTVEYLVQGAILLIMCAVVQRVNWRYLLAFAVAVIYGYVMDMWMLVFKNVVLTEAYLKWIMLIAGDVMTAAGVACFSGRICRFRCTNFSLRNCPTDIP